MHYGPEAARSFSLTENRERQGQEQTLWLSQGNTEV